MASLKIPEAVPSPIQDSERLRKAFQGLFLSLSHSHPYRILDRDFNAGIDEFMTH